MFKTCCTSSLFPQTYFTPKPLSLSSSYHTNHTATFKLRTRNSQIIQLSINESSEQAFQLYDTPVKKIEMAAWESTERKEIEEIIKPETPIWQLIVLSSGSEQKKHVREKVSFRKHESQPKKKPGLSLPPSPSFSLSSPLHLTHLTPRALSNLTSSFILYSNKLQFLTLTIPSLRKYPSPVLHQLLNSIQHYQTSIIKQFTQLYIIADYQAGSANRRHVMQQLDLQGGNYQIQEPLTLIRLVGIVKDKMEAMDIVTGIVNKIVKGVTGGDNKNCSVVVLDCLWDMLDKFENEEIKEPISQLLLKLTIQPMKRYLEMVERWLRDSMKTEEKEEQFFVKKGESEVYQVRGQEVPEFLKETAGRVFEYGKFIKVIYCFASEEDVMNISQFMNSREEFDRVFWQMDRFLNTNNNQNQYQSYRDRMQQIFKQKEKRQKKFHSISSLLKQKDHHIKLAKIKQQPQPLPYDLHIRVNHVFQINQYPSPQSNTILSPEIMYPYYPNKSEKNSDDDRLIFLSSFKTHFSTSLLSLLSTIQLKCSQYFNLSSPVPPFDTIPLHIFDHLFCIQSFLLFQQGDFIQDLIENIGLELEKPSSIIKDALIGDLLETTVLNSNARFVKQQLVKNLKGRFMMKEAEVSGWYGFYLEYKLEAPFHYLFPQSTMRRYNKIFNFIWKLRYLQHLIRQIGDDTKGQKQTKSYYLFKNALGLFAGTVLADVMLKVRYEWERFVEQIKKVEGLEEFLSRHEGVVSRLQKIAFIGGKEEKGLSVKLWNIIQVAMKLRDLMRSNEVEERDKQREIEKLREEWMVRVKDLVYVHESFAVEIVDFSRFYDQIR